MEKLGSRRQLEAVWWRSLPRSLLLPPLPEHEAGTRPIQPRVAEGLGAAPLSAEGGGVGVGEEASVDQLLADHKLGVGP